ncbi:AAA family ATPase [Alysiella filiformis]|uniref:AAA domain-containing protein, putative AbiEii toxin, Type IV TA system n=1 Tax=Alysiella filiformis DSM 16848 TaxID=1120981 RepID=A0A286EG51_9NEIS|nr:AAA family ATPase [Alysiella filiformis]QMT31212.1 AAA family ATPase [Alysiella filiformis]UBQ55790.1 ATP-binding protein [Alysiella filiformis DSM 16848]SOD69888.1 AAA domain-containing protein, putative AbiEii toxin, Type IV TA system [Alysiella filiformis DSM 16848]
MQFTVENLGKVSKADIDLKPLTIFIGKNGSGKTYVASALWAYISYIKSIENVTDNISTYIPKNIYNKYKNILSNFLHGFDGVLDYKKYFIIKKEDIEIIFNNINNHISKNKLLRDCFKHNGFEEANFNSTNDLNNICANIKLKVFYKPMYYQDDFDNTLKEHIHYHYFTFDLFLDNLKLYENSMVLNLISDGIIDLNDIHSDEIINAILKNIIKYAFFGQSFDNYNEVLYIPAARTGLMFGLHDFANSSLKRNSYFGIENHAPKSNDLTAPLNNFVSNLYGKLEFEPIYQEEQRFNSLIDGEIKVNRQDKRFKYIPKSLNQELPLSASSSLVTETAVLSIFNNSIKKGSFVIFEEPEAHLHLSAQREMAKLIVKMINQGCHMLITTHSDTFLQQLNNLIMLNKLSENNPDILQEFNIGQDETIAGEKVAVYDFQYQDDDKTVAKPLELGDYGFIAPSVNDEINNLIRQTDTIIDMIDNLKSNGE